MICSGQVLNIWHYYIRCVLCAGSDGADPCCLCQEDLQSERDRQASSEQSHTSQLRHTQELLAQRSSQLEQLRAELQQLSSTSSSQLQQQLAAEREKARQVRMAGQRRSARPSHQPSHS